MKILEFLQEDNGRFSSARLSMLLVVLGFTSDWVLHIIRSIEFDPCFSIVTIVSAIMGIKVFQKTKEK